MVRRGNRSLECYALLYEEDEGQVVSTQFDMKHCPLKTISRSGRLMIEAGTCPSGLVLLESSQLELVISSVWISSASAGTMSRKASIKFDRRNVIPENYQLIDSGQMTSSLSTSIMNYPE